MQEVCRHYKRPVDDRYKRARDQTDCLQRFFLDVELAIEPFEAEFETPGSFNDEAGAGVEP